MSRFHSNISIANESTLNWPAAAHRQLPQSRVPRFMLDGLAMAVVDTDITVKRMNYFE
jgi:hypothetical protein